MHALFTRRILLSSWGDTWGNRQKRIELDNISTWN